MTLFLTLMLVGLAGLAMMAIPGFGRHGHSGHAGAGHVGGHAGHGLLHSGHAHGAAHAPSGAQSGAHAHGHTQLGQVGREGGILPPAFRLSPSPRMIFSLLAVFGALGYALVGIAHLSSGLAALIALIPTLLIEWLLVTPLWNMALQFQGKPVAPLTELVMGEAQAVTPFHNGRGMVCVEHDGRKVQFVGVLSPNQATMPVQVGDRLTIEDIDPAKERVVVSVRS